LLGVAFLAAMPMHSAAIAQQTAPAGGVPQLPPITPIARPALVGEFPLYPGKPASAVTEQWESYLGGPIVRNVTTPTLVPLRPAADKVNGTAVIYAPGGGFFYLGMNDAEPQKLVDQGITVFVLKYRTNSTDRDPRTFLTNMYTFLFAMAVQNRSPTGPASKAPHAPPEALEDGLAAVRLIRSRATEWGIDPARIGFMGSSAGAMTGMDVSYTADDQARPDFLVTIIGPKQVDEVPSTAPPLFAVASNDDPLFPGATENLVAAWSKAGRPVEAHFFERGGHGLPKGTTGEPWFGLLVEWLKMRGFIPTT
jgi:acetyl esterase/lipase